MEFISAREFKEKSEEVQKVFLDWWEPSKGDIYCNLYNNQEENVLVVNDCQLEMFKTFKADIKTLGVPLLTEGQLRKFIEDKMGGVVKVIQWHIEDSNVSKRGYSIDILSRNRYSVTHHFKDLGEDLLKAYWKVACEIVECSLKEK